MDATASMAANAAANPSSGMAGTSRLSIDISAIQPADSAQFRSAMEAHIHAKVEAKSDSASLGKAIVQRASSLASNVQDDQKYVSKMLEQATRTGSSMQLMKAMMALNDYQLRVQTISKTVSKAASSVDSLTKLQ